MFFGYDATQIEVESIANSMKKLKAQILKIKKEIVKENNL